MESRILNYRIIVKPHKEGKKNIYLAECPTLGVYDWGQTIEEVLKNIQEALECHVEALMQEKEEIPIDYPEKELVTETQITIPSHVSIASS